MKQIFYDMYGRAILWMLRNDRLVDAYGNSIGFVVGDSVFDYNGVHRGWFENGFIRDRNGLCVAFLSSARGASPVLPIRQIPPIPSIPSIEPIRPIRQIKPIKPIKQLAWSQYSPIDLFRI